MRSVLAADFGGTKCRIALITEDLGVHGARHIETPRRRDEFLARIDEAFDRARQDPPAGSEPPGALGVGVAGIIERGGQEVIGAPNLPLDGFSLGAHLASRHGLPTALLNDGRASAWGEYLRGHARGRDPLLALFFGTGIGIGLMVGGAPFEGATGAAGEIGHTIHVPGGRRCSCGRRGCYEAYCGGRPMAERAAAEIGPTEDGTWDVSGILRRATGDPRAAAILADAERAARAMVASACTLLNPSAVVIGGGVAGAWPELRRSLEAFTRDFCTEPITRELVFVDSLGGSDAVLWGAAAATGHLTAD